MYDKDAGGASTTCLLIILLVFAVIVFGGVLMTADPDTLSALATAVPK